MSIEFKIIEKRSSSRLWENMKELPSVQYTFLFPSPALLPSWNIIPVEGDSNHSNQNLPQISSDLLKGLHFMKPRWWFFMFGEEQGIKNMWTREGFKNLLSPDRLRFAFGLYGEAKNKRGELAWLTWNIETKLSFYYCLLCAETAYQPSSNTGTILFRKSFWGGISGNQDGIIC